jgi:hypothetical protein
MKPESNQDRLRAAFGQTIAACAQFRALKDGAEARLAQGESEESIREWLAEQTSEETTAREKMHGFGEWLTGWLLEWAKTGEPGPTYPGFPGTVGIDLIDVDGQPTLMVFAMATALTDARDLAEQFVVVCNQVFPYASRKHFQDAVKAARYYRLHEEGLSWGEIARQNVKLKLPRMKETDPRFRKQVKLERDRARHMGGDWWDKYGKKLVEFLSLE